MEEGYTNNNKNNNSNYTTNTTIRMESFDEFFLVMDFIRGFLTTALRPAAY